MFDGRRLAFRDEEEQDSCQDESSSEEEMEITEESASTDACFVPRSTSQTSNLSRPPYETMDVPYRFRSPVLLLWGGVFGMLGFLVAFMIGLLNFFHRTVNFQGHPYASGHGYWPATVSEMVYEWNSPEGRIFFGFCLISAFLIFQSWYPYELRNVFTGSEVIHRRFPVYWITFRQMVPVVGLLMLISVSTVPSALASPSDDFAVVVHLMGAAMMFVGYIVAELKCLQMCGMAGGVQAKYLDIEGPERTVREVLMTIVLISYLIFCFCQVALVVGASTEPPMCCADKFATGRAKAGVNLARATLETASGTYLMLKIVSFVSEVLSGLALIGSHIVIWYYCEERFVNFAEDGIRAVYDEENHVELHHHAHTLYAKNAKN